MPVKRKRTFESLYKQDSFGTAELPLRPGQRALRAARWTGAGLQGLLSKTVDPAAKLEQCLEIATHLAVIDDRPKPPRVAGIKFDRVARRVDGHELRHVRSGDLLHCGDELGFQYPHIDRLKAPQLVAPPLGRAAIIGHPGAVVMRRLAPEIDAVEALERPVGQQPLDHRRVGIALCPVELPEE